jgi:hypothetical protein
MTALQTWTFGRLDDYPAGPWTGEPDKAQWVDEATGLDCLAVRNRIGAWCGYVGVPPGHPLHGADYEDPDVDVHGGLTYASPCQEDRLEGICHVPEPGRPADVWWFGFDCAHLGDMSPYDAKDRFADPGARIWKYRTDDVYRDLGYVRLECGSLAAQLKVAS